MNKQLDMSEPEFITKTLKVRVKDKHKKLLQRMSVEVNQVWNYANDLSRRSIIEKKVWLSGFDINNHTSGASKEFNYIGSNTIQETAEEYVKKRNQAKRVKLKFRKSFGRKRSLGWIPFNCRSCVYMNGQIRFMGNFFSLWDSYGLGDYKFRAGCFTEDARGRWYFCVAVRVSLQESNNKSAIGVDLGLKDAAVCSNGVRLESGQYRSLESDLGIAQRANNKSRARNINAKIKNRRKDEQHKFTRDIVNSCGAVYIGGVSTQFLIKTNAKSAHDVGHYSLKTMMQYKCQQAGVRYEEVNEMYTTQTCSSCGLIGDNSPKGRAGLGIRQWECECGSLHDRDINAAINILNVGVGHGPLGVENSLC